MASYFSSQLTPCVQETSLHASIDTTTFWFCNKRWHGYMKSGMIESFPFVLAFTEKHRIVSLKAQKLRLTMHHYAKENECLFFTSREHITYQKVWRYCCLYSMSSRKQSFFWIDDSHSCGYYRFAFARCEDQFVTDFLTFH